MMPPYIMVGGSRYELQQTDAAWRTQEGADGHVDFESMTICVNVEAKESEILNTLLHELSHVIWREWNLPSRPREERAVTAFGYGWAALFTQNPELTEVINGLIDASSGNSRE